jgi:signal transduction histidine kinase
LHAEATEELLTSMVEDPGHLQALRDAKARSVMLMPLTVREHALGVVTLISDDSERQFSDEDLALAQEISNRAAQALEKARLYEEAKEAVQLRDEFLSVASHELKTPLTSLHLQLQSLLRPAERVLADEQLNGRVSLRLDSAFRQVLRLEKLVSNLLDISRISSGTLELELERVELADVVREVVSRLTPDLRRSGCEVRVDGAPVTGTWDRFRVEQILTNLLTNAMKFGENKSIEVTFGAL